MPKEHRIYIERRIHYFKCTVCGHPNRQSFYKRKANGGVCAKCKRTMPDPNQTTLL